MSRLEEIENKKFYSIREKDYTQANDVIWLIGQAKVKRKALESLKLYIEENKRLKEQVSIFEMKYESTGSIFNRRHQIDRIEALQEENKRYKKDLESVERSLLKANKGYVNNRDFYVNYNINDALETIQALKDNTK